MASWLWGTSQVDEAIDRATSELLPAGTEDIALNLEICDQIRSKTVPPKDAAKALKRRLNHKNPNVQLLTLGLADTCIKNGGDHFLVEIASRDFMDNLVSILKMPALNYEVKTKLLRLVQNWAMAFEGKPSLSYVPQVYQSLKGEGFNFPPKDPSVLSAAMVDTKTAPEWIDSEVCLRCRDPFTFTNRKHHCRNCGQVFDHKCSSKLLPLPHYGITQAVRVCEICYPKLARAPTTHRKSYSVDSRHSARHRPQDFEDAELQRAIQLSLQESGQAGQYGRPGYVPSQPPYWQASEPPLVDRKTYPGSVAEEEEDPDLRAAIEASLRDAHAPQPSAPIGMDTPRAEHQQPYFSYAGPGYAQSYPPSTVSQPPAPSVPALPNYDLAPLESDVIMTFNQAVEHVQGQPGQDVRNFPAMNELYGKAGTLTGKLSANLDDAGRKEELLTEMHTKLSQAVKIYDRLLTEQVSRPAWQAQSPPPQQYASYAPPQTNGYAYAAPPPPMSNGYFTQPQPVASPPPMSSGYAAAEFSQPQAGAPQFTHPQPVSVPQFSPSAAGPSSPRYAAPVAWQSMASPQQQQQYSAPTPAPESSPSYYQPQQQYQPPQEQQQYQPPQQQYQPPQQQYQPQLPAFPSAPTTAPAPAFYGAPAPTSMPTERKEALLIEL